MLLKYMCYNIDNFSKKLCYNKKKMQFTAKNPNYGHPTV